jgi:hypothetical protein
VLCIFEIDSSSNVSLQNSNFVSIGGGYLEILVILKNIFLFEKILK